MKVAATVVERLTAKRKMDREIVWDMFTIKYHLVYKLISCGRNRLHRLIRPYVMPPTTMTAMRHDSERAGVYVLIADSFYIGMTISHRERLFQHINDSKAHRRYEPRKQTRPNAQTHPEILLHRDMANRGIGRYTLVFLTATHAPTQLDARQLLKANIRRQEAWFIHNLARQHRRTLNVVGTWHQMRGRMHRNGLHRLHDIAPASHGRMSVTQQQDNSFTRFAVWIPDARTTIWCHDLYTVLTSLAKRNNTAGGADRIRVIHGAIHSSRYDSIRHAYGGSVAHLHYSDGRDPVVIMLEQTTAALIAPPLHTIKLITIVHRTRTAPLEIRRMLARLIFDRPLARQFERECTLLQLHRYYRLSQRMKKTRQAPRRSRLVMIGKRKFGIHPSLIQTIKIQTPRTVTRQQVLDSARDAIRTHSRLSPEVTNIVASQLKVVLTRCKRVVDIFDNVRRHCATWTTGQTRPCICQTIEGYWRHPETKCVVFTSKEYKGWNADILHQSYKTILYPNNDTTKQELESQLLTVLDALAKAAGNQPNQKQPYNCPYPTQVGGHMDTPPNVDMKRTQRLAKYLTKTLGLVCGVCDKSKGELFFSCPHHLDTLIATVFPIEDATRFKRIQHTKAELLRNVLQPLADEYRGIITDTRCRNELGLFYVSLKKYERTSPKYHSKARPISNYSGDPLAALFSVAGKALMWMIRQTADEGILPWIMTRTEDLVPFLRDRMLEAADKYAHRMQQVRWHVKVADAEGFY
jgi:hypothetical protein